MKNYKLAMLLALFFLVGFVLGGGWSQPAVPRIPAPASQEQAEKTVSIMFVFDENALAVAERAWRENLTLFSATQEAAQSNNLFFEFKDYGDLGALVTKIGDKENGQDQQYWQYWVNNRQIQTASDKLLLQPGDVISWHFRKSEM